MPLDSKLPDVGTTIFTVMSRLAAECGAINLSQGYPDFNSPPELLDLVTAAMQAGQNQYAPMAGLEALRQAIAGKVRQLYGATVDPEAEITVVSGATEGLFNAISAVIAPGDEAVILDPAYDSYDPVIRLNGGRAIRVAMHYPDYSIDWDEVADAVTDRTRLLMINSPHNPTGMVLRQPDIDALKEIIRRRDLYLISDEVYEHIIFDGLPHLSLLRFPELRERAFVISSFGKTYHATGWKLGYCIAPPALTVEYRKIHQFNTFTSCTPMQAALARYLVSHPEHYRELPRFYQAKRDHLLRVMQDSRFKALPCSGTYFQLFDYSAISHEQDRAFAERITREHGVASIPVSVFYGDQRDDKVIRLCFAKSEDTLSRAAEILCRL
jgi:methionine aminotransferase